MSFSFSKRFFEKLSIFLFLLFVVFISVPQKAAAQYVDISEAAKEYIADPIAFQIANMMIKKISSETINWINSGFQGSPAFVQNPGQFFLDVADQQASIFLSEPAMNQICTPFNAQVRIALVKNYLANPTQNYSCTLDKLQANYDQFTQNFSSGGWDEWFQITQNQQNNPYGAYIAAQDQLQIKIATAQGAKQKQLDQNNGFLSFQQCAPGTALTQADIDGSDLYQAAGLKVGDCLPNAKVTVTPGSLIQNQLNQAVGSGQNRLNVGDEIDEIIGSLFSELANKALSSVVGLSKSSNGSDAFTSQLASEQEPGPSNPNAANITMTPGTITCTQGNDTVNPDGSISHGGINCTVTTGTANLCAATANSHGNDPGAPTTIDPDDITYLTTDISGWTPTASLADVTAAPAGVHFDYSLNNPWNSFDLGGGPTNTGFASTWILFWRKDTVVPEVLPDNIKAELTTLQTELTNFENGWLQNKGPIGKTWLMAGDSQGSLFGIGGNTISDKQDYFNKLTGENANGSDTATQGILLEAQLIQFDMTQKPTKYPKAWSLLSPKINALSDQLSVFEAIFNDVLQRDGQEATQLDAEKFANDSLQTIPKVDATLGVIKTLLNPDPNSGHWIAFPFDYLLDKSPNDVSIAGLFCNSQDFEPVAGETYGFMISTPAGNSTVISDPENKDERSNIITFTWPAGINRPNTGGVADSGPSGAPGICDASNERPPVTPTDDASIAQYVNASYKGWTGKDDTQSDIDYWVGVSDHYGAPFSNGLCYIGWNRYWETRINPSNPGSADPNLAELPPQFLP